MNEERKLSPEELLTVIQREEAKAQKGRLKIFLGMCAGVGKTYSMLEEAQKMRSLGVQVSVGIVNTHGRVDTAALLEGLEQIPLQEIIYKETPFFEFNLDATLQKKPDLVIVDELAHTNIPGARHVKRWQDIMELLEQGIDVYTTLNVQHIESLKDVVEDITGVTIRETVPDLVVAAAAFVVLVDITVEELLSRLKEGKVYLGEQSVLAAQHFFQENRLTALRELVLRYMAEKIDHDLHDMSSALGQKEEWRPRERLLVCVSHSPHSQKLIRATRRYSSMLNAPWIALHVDDGMKLTSDEQVILNKNIAIARDLGAEVITVADTDIAEAIQRIARRRGVTQIIIGRTPKRTLFSRCPLVDKLVLECTDIDIHVLRQTFKAPYTHKKKSFSLFEGSFLNYGLAAIATGLLTALNSYLASYFSHTFIGCVFLAGLLSLSLFLRRGPILFAALLSAAIWKYFFIPQAEASTEDNIIIVLYVLIAGSTGILADRARTNREMLLKQEETSRALYEIVRNIASAPSIEHILQSVRRVLSRILNGSCDIIVKPMLDIHPPELLMTSLKDEKERACALWVLENGQEAGWSTNTLPATKHLFLPLKGFSEVVGILSYCPNKDVELTVEEKNFLYTVGKQLGNYFERSMTEEKQHKIDLLNQIEQIYKKVLDQVSSQFETPLSTIQSAINELKGEKAVRDNKVASVAMYCIENSAGELIRTIKNAGVLARLSAESLTLNKEKHHLSDLITTSCEQVKRSQNGHTLSIHIQEDLPLIKCDRALLEILFQNLLLNAMEYSPSKSTVQVEAKRHGNMLVVSIEDEGKGIPENMLHSVFEKFYRLPGTSSMGLGLGLSIAKTIAELHGGRVLAANRKEGGTKISVFLPI